jgi:hypothetical protein
MAPSPPRLRILSGAYPFLLPRHVLLPKASRFDPASHLVDSSPLLPLGIAWLSQRYLQMSLELRRYCIVGGNAVSAFLSWRLQATNACDVTLVWKNGYQAVAQYGISFK